MYVQIHSKYVIDICMIINVCKTGPVKSVLFMCTFNRDKYFLSSSIYNYFYKLSRSKLENVLKPLNFLALNYFKRNIVHFIIFVYFCCLVLHIKFNVLWIVWITAYEMFKITRPLSKLFCYNMSEMWLPDLFFCRKYCVTTPCVASIITK